MPRRLPDPPAKFNSLDDVRAYLLTLGRVETLELQDLHNAVNPGVNLQSMSLVNVSVSYGPGKNSVILCDASASAITITLPNPADYYRDVFVVKKVNTGANNVTIKVSSSGTIDTSVSYSLTGANKPAVTVISDGTEYKIIGKY